MKQLCLLPLLLAMLLTSACSRNDVEKNLEWKETEAPENLVDVVFAGSATPEVSTRAAFGVGTPVTVRVYKRANATTMNLSAAPYKTATGVTTGTGTDVADLSRVSFTGGNITNGKLQVSRGSTYDFVVTVNEPATGTSLTGSTLSNLPTGTKLLAGRATGVAVSNSPLTTSVTVTCDAAAGADSYGNLPQLTSKIVLDITFPSAYINSLGIAGATVKVKSLTLKNVNTKASLNFTGNPLALSGAATPANYTFTTADNNSYTISSLNNGFTYDGGIYVLPTTAASTLNYDLVLTINGTDNTISGSANLPTMQAGKVYTLESSTFKMYNVVYDTNGGTGPAPQFKAWGTNITIPTTPPTRTGYNFLGWALSRVATTAYITPGTIMTDATLGKSSFSTASVTLYAIWGPVAHRGWAGSNIYWDATLGHLTFDDVNVTTHERYQGLFFQWGSLWGISPVTGAWSASTILYSPNGTSGAASTYGYSTWGSWPQVTATVLADRNRAYAYEIHDPSKGVGDICKYMTDKGWAPAGKKWRLPTSNEFETASNYARTGAFGAIASYDANGQFDTKGGLRKTDVSNGITTTPLFPYAGYRDYNTPGEATYAGGGNYYWSSSSQSATNGYGLGAGSSDVYSLYALPRSKGTSIRCVVE